MRWFAFGVLALALLRLDPASVRALGADEKEPRVKGKTVKEWIELLKSAPSPRAKGEAAQALGEFNDKGEVAVPALTEALKTAHPEVKYYSAQALSQIGSAGVPGLIEALKSKDVGTRVNGAKWLGSVQPAPKAAVAPLSEALKDENRTVRTWAVIALSQYGTVAKPAVSALIGALKDPDKEVQSKVQDALKKIDPEAAKKAGVK
jgi:HEAT repeat protein